MKLKDFKKINENWNNWHRQQNVEEALPQGYGTKNEGEGKFQVGEFVYIIDGGLRGATGEIVEPTTLVTGEEAYVIRLYSDADKKVFGQQGDEVIAGASALQSGRTRAGMELYDIDEKLTLKKKLDEKAASKAQQRFMGAVKGCKETGDCGSPEIKKAADSMTDKEVDDFAGTKHKGLPDKVEEGRDISYSDVRKEYDAILAFLKKDILQKQGSKTVADALELLANDVRDSLYNPDPYDKDNYAYFDIDSGTQPNLKEDEVENLVNSVLEEMFSDIEEAAKCDGPTEKASSDRKDKKWMRCVKSDSGGYKRIHWGQKGVRVTGKSGDTDRKKSFKARHNCSDAKSNTPQGQACKDWAE